ncbi:hypothetical protein AABM34_11370 [Lysinibacillus fusiformis]
MIPWKFMQLSYLISAQLSQHLEMVLQTIAAGLALEALVNANKDSSQNNNGDNQSNVQIDTMQKQIDYLIGELKHIKKMLK